MGLFDNWPYTNFHELNLDWLLRMVKELNNKVENFVALNTIKYANPIQWNITTQYEANTVVVDPQSGTAYISAQPVPAGVALTNTDYWSVIFTLDIISANKNLTLRDDGSNVLATFASNAGDWLLWNGTLYKVSQTINVNEAYVAGYNLTRYTVELFIREYISNIINTIGDLSDLNTSDKSSIVNAINEVFNKPALIAKPEDFGAVGDGVTNDTIPIQNALNSAKVVYLTNDKTYAISTVTVPKGHSIIGVGTLKLLNDSMIDGIILEGDNEIKDITITDGYTSLESQYCAITGNEVSNCEITNVNINNIHFGYGIRFTKSDNLKINHNTITNYSYAGIMLLNGCRLSDVSYNYVYNGRGSFNNRYAICISGYFEIADREAEEITCNYNRCIDLIAQWEGIDSHSCKNCEFIGNYIKGFSRGIVLTNPTSAPALPDMCKNVIIKNNTIISDSDANGLSIGISVSNVNSDNVEVSNNDITCNNAGTFHTSGSSAISFRGGPSYIHKNVKISNNTVYTLSNGISIVNADCLLISSNNISGMGSGSDSGINLSESTIQMNSATIKDNKLDSIVAPARSFRGANNVAAIVIYENNVDNGVYENTLYTTTPQSSLNNSIKALERKGAMVPSTASGIAFWICRGANDWLSVAGTSV